jgi:sortase A
VLEDKGDNRLTLTACHPKFSARERIIVSAQLVGNPVPPLPDQEAVSAPTERRAVFEDIDGETASKWPAVLWGLACAGIWLACWLLARLVRRRVDRRSRARHAEWLPYLVGIVPFGICLYLFFENFSLFLPASY